MTAIQGATLMWNGFELVREDFYGIEFTVIVPENVLTPRDRTLTVHFYNGSSDVFDLVEYGVNEVIQVNLDEQWYSLPRMLRAKEQPLLLPPLPRGANFMSEESRTEYTVDLSVFGVLPPGNTVC